MQDLTPRRQLIDAGRDFYARGWVLGTSGNFSAVVAQAPLRLLITRSAAHKGHLDAKSFLEVDERGRGRGRPDARPSAETLLHLEVVRARGAGSVLHTHSIWSTVLSDAHEQDAGVAIEGFEMLKGLHGVTSHEHREWIPILPNDQDMPRLAARVRAVLDAHPAAHAFLLARHGLYTWGATVDDARRHVEILEFLFEAIGRRRSR
jgi:methylthioribulose-1-phosphate dehydratase